MQEYLWWIASKRFDAPNQWAWHVLKRGILVLAFWSVLFVLVLMRRQVLIKQRVWMMGLVPMAILYVAQSQSFWVAIRWARGLPDRISSPEIAIPILIFVAWVLLYFRLACWPRFLCNTTLTRLICLLSAGTLALANWVFYYLDSPLANSALWASVTGGAICLFFAIFPEKMPQPRART